MKKTLQDILMGLGVLRPQKYITGYKCHVGIITRVSGGTNTLFSPAEVTGYNSFFRKYTVSMVDGDKTTVLYGIPEKAIMTPEIMKKNADSFDLD